MKTTTDLLSEVLGASSLSELPEAAGKKPKRVFLIYARQIHPDLFLDADEKAKATKAFAHLTRLRDLGSGKTSPTAAAKNKIKTKRHEYQLKDVVAETDTFLKYHVEYDAGHAYAQMAILKNPKDSDLADAHVSALKQLNDVPDKYSIYFPDLVESFRYRDASSTDRTVVVTHGNEVGFRPMSDILKVYPDGISGRDVAWMFRRMLVAIGNAHDVGLVNGAPTLDAFLIHDAMHGIILTDWEYSVEKGQPLKAVPSEYRWAYPESVFKKEPATYALDIYVVSKMAEKLLAKTEPKQLTAFFKGCRLANVPTAPKLLAEFDALLDRLYGKRTFHEFTLEKEK